MAAPVLLVVPLDDRPVTLDMAVDLGRAAGADVRTPDRQALGGRFRPGAVDQIWSWLEREAQTGAAALIASAEMLCFGGLVASRKSGAEFEDIAPLLQRLYAIAARVPAYLSAVIPRTPREPTDEDAQDSIGGRHRSRQSRMNAELIDAAARGTLRYLLIGQDDTWPGSPSQKERDALLRHAAAKRASNVMLTSGADELNVRLLARWLNALTGVAPSVRIVYTFPERRDQIPRYEATPLQQTVEEHIRSTGAQIVPSPTADILLWVHNFEGQQQEARDQPGTIDAGRITAAMRDVRGAVQAERVVALADVRFANGADRALVTQLLDEPLLGGIAAYAGWNTCSNTLGSVVAQGVIAHHLRAGMGRGDDGFCRKELLARVLDDWGYQAIVRPHLTQWLQQRGGDAAHLAEHEAATESHALAQLRADVLPAIERSFGDRAVSLRRVAFPWHRLFEIRLDLEVAARVL